MEVVQCLVHCVYQCQWLRWGGVGEGAAQLIPTLAKHPLQYAVRHTCSERGSVPASQIWPKYADMQNLVSRTVMKLYSSDMHSQCQAHCH